MILQWWARSEGQRRPLLSFRVVSCALSVLKESAAPIYAAALTSRPGWRAWRPPSMELVRCTAVCWPLPKGQETPGAALWGSPGARDGMGLLLASSGRPVCRRAGYTLAVMLEISAPIRPTALTSRPDGGHGHRPGVKLATSCTSCVSYTISSRSGLRLGRCAAGRPAPGRSGYAWPSC